MSATEVPSCPGCNKSLQYIKAENPYGSAKELIMLSIAIVVILGGFIKTNLIMGLIVSAMVLTALIYKKIHESNAKQVYECVVCNKKFVGSELEIIE